MAKFNKILYMEFRATLTFRKFKVALNHMYRIFKGLRAFLAGHSVAMVTYSVTKIIPMCLPMIGQFFDPMIVALTYKEW